ncbi:hypothetical protein X275_06160 [Marinitoga sp. 1197]|uniref:nicotinamide-nucleotide amidohydrolase family protein n=1 Tax=Marinitoga sp. 1197 TaxID=1428449 RepID=UPI00064141FB|nr:nicotinamide-nucleotide amidohydrolase family protein [Marinitoga sp. 1197]KLO22425.1 hypothetical protein X275_06160 [Marinitoga sp. 1197]
MIYIRVGILSTGDELIEGEISNITSKEISNILYNEGFEISTHICVRDNKEDIISSLSFLSTKNDVIIITGGLGSTIDDITRNAVAEFLNIDLILNTDVYNDIINRYKRFGKTPNKFIKRQAYILKNSIILKNDIGSAPGLYITKNNKHYILLPGPPDEALYMFKKYFKHIFGKFDKKRIYTKKIQFYNITESQLISILEKHLENINYSTKLELEMGPSLIFKDNKEKLKSIIDFINNQLIEYVVPDNPLKYIINNLSNNNKTISTAESCTGGLVGNFITNIPGSSRVYKGSIVAYNNYIKNKLLHVDNEVLKNYGAVSEKAVKLMAINTAKIFDSDFSISISGVAGPDGGTKNLPVGTVFFGFYYKLYDKIIIEKKRFSGDRILIKRKAAFYSLIRFLKLFL